MIISLPRSRVTRIFATAIVLAGILLSHLLAAAPQPQVVVTSGKAYRLQLYHTHTKERLDVIYRVGRAYLPEATDELDHFLRDHRTGDASLFRRW